MTVASQLGQLRGQLELARSCLSRQAGRPGEQIAPREEFLISCPVKFCKVDKSFSSERLDKLCARLGVSGRLKSIAHQNDISVSTHLFEIG